MRKSFAALVLAGLAITSTPGRSIRPFAPSLAVEPLHQTNDPSINTFWTKFRAAVITSDKTAVANMSQFPIEMSYGIAPVRNRSQLLKRYREVFSEQANARTCFAGAKPKIDPDNRNRFSVWCKDSAGNEVVVYGFVRTKAGWKFNSLDNINE